MRVSDGQLTLWGAEAPRRTLEDIRAEVMACAKCRLRAGCRAPVFGEGPVPSPLMFVGEGPGATEDEIGRPFVGAAGQLLDRIIAAGGWRREEVYITNVVRCRPPGNRQPAPDEMQTCLPYLLEMLPLIQPRIIVCLGATAARGLIDPEARITRLRGRWVERWGVRIMPTYHPAALLRDPSKKRDVWEDIKAVRAEWLRLAGGGA